MSRWDGPLPEWSIVAGALLGALALWILARLLMKASSAMEKKGNEGTASTSIGCLGVVLSWAAIGCLIPLLIWVEQVGVALLFVAGIAVVLIVIIGWLRAWLK